MIKVIYRGILTKLAYIVILVCTAIGILAAVKWYSVFKGQVKSYE